jgi:hypothetical protein
MYEINVNVSGLNRNRTSYCAKTGFLKKFDFFLEKQKIVFRPQISYLDIYAILFRYLCFRRVRILLCIEWPEATCTSASPSLRSTASPTG